MRKFCKNNSRKFPASGKPMNPTFLEDLHPESHTSHLQQIPTIPFPPPKSPIALSPWAQLQPWQLCCCRRAAGADRSSLGEGWTLGLSHLHSQGKPIRSVVSLQAKPFFEMLLNRFNGKREVTVSSGKQAEAWPVWAKASATVWSCGKHCPFSHAASCGVGRFGSSVVC